MRKQRDEQGTRVCMPMENKHKHVLEKYLLIVVGCMLLIVGCSYYNQTETNHMKRPKEVVFRVEDYLIEQTIPLEIRCFAGEIRNMSDTLNKEVEAMIVPLSALVIPEGLETTLQCQEYIYESDTLTVGPYAMLQYYAKNDEYNITATIMDLQHPDEPYEDYIDDYVFKEYKQYEIAITEIQNTMHHAIYRVDGYHKNHKYKISMYVDVETREDFEKFLKSFLI